MKAFFLNDDGDSSVGIPSTLIAELNVSNEMYELMEEQKTKSEFIKKFEALISEFFEPEFRYSVVDEEAEQRYIESQRIEQEEKERKLCEETRNNVKHTIGNGWKLEFSCNRCKNKFWAEGGIAQVDCPVCSPKHLENYPIITGKSEKI